MIVKNEEKVLPRLMRSVKDYIDYYVVVDTGSTDDTIALIKQEMAGFGVEGEVHERAWVNFGVNRQQALDLAVEAGKAEWLLFIDADEELGVSDPKFYEKLEPGVSYDLEKHHGRTRYAVPHLVNIRTGKFQWKGPVHNYLVTLVGEKKRAVRKDVWIVYHPGEGAKSQGLTTEQKYLRDAKLLEDDLEKHPDSARSQFYLGQSYRDAGHLEKALQAYARRATMSGWDEETFVAQLEAGKLAVRLERSEQVVLEALLSAYDRRPTRAEPLFELARYFRLKKNYGKAFLFSKVGALTSPPNDALFVDHSVYEWRLLDELAVSAYWIGNYSECKLACEQLLRRTAKGVDVSEEDVRRIRANLKLAHDKLALEAVSAAKSREKALQYLTGKL
jgi:hypothetical protein